MSIKKENRSKDFREYVNQLRSKKLVDGSGGK